MLSSLDSWILNIILTLTISDSFIFHKVHDVLRLYVSMINQSTDGDEEEICKENMLIYADRLDHTISYLKALTRILL